MGKAPTGSASEASKVAKPLKSPKTPKADKFSKATKENGKSKDRLATGLDSALVERAVGALLKFHEKTSADKVSLLGTDQPIQVQFTLLRAPGRGSSKPIRVLIPHPLFKLADKADDSDGPEEPEICLIVKEESKELCQLMIEKFPEHMGCVKKVLGLRSLREKHASYEQRRELLNKYNFFMADERILPMLLKALGSDFSKAKKLPIPINLTRKEALPFAIRKALSATYMTVSTGTCVNIR
jgi:ribosome biogenesis protein UTP30